MIGGGVVHLADLGQSVQVSVDGGIFALAEAVDDDLVMQMTLFVHRDPGVTGRARTDRRRHELTRERNRELCRGKTEF